PPRPRCLIIAHAPQARLRLRSSESEAGCCPIDEPASLPSRAAQPTALKTQGDWRAAVSIATVPRPRAEEGEQPGSCHQLQLQRQRRHLALRCQLPVNVLDNLTCELVWGVELGPPLAALPLQPICLPLAILPV